MRDHLEDYWGFYVFVTLFVALLLTAFNVSAENNRRKAYCYDRGSVLVDTDAGPRCAPLYSLERIRGN